jgi:hypothetical protein
MANLILSHTVPSGNFAKIMAALTEVQNLLRRTSAHEAIGAKCPRFIRTRWFYMNDTLVFILEHAGAITPYLQMVSEVEPITQFYQPFAEDVKRPAATGNDNNREMTVYGPANRFLKVDECSSPHFL